MADSSTYNINYEDERFKTVEQDKAAALTEHDKMYGDMISNSDKYYQEQIDASKDWEKKQTEIQNQQTDFAVEKIEQQQEQEEKEYTKEQSGAYVDWQQQKNDYGVNAEQEAANGMKSTGYSESSQVGFYNTYQNRVAKARESFRLAVVNYQNAIKDARLQNNAKLAEIAYQALQRQLELSLQMFQAKNTLLLEQADKKLQIESLYYQKHQDVLDQINKENALAEEVRQFNEKMAEERRQFDAVQSRYINNGSGGGHSGGSSGGSSSGGSSSGGSSSGGSSSGYSSSRNYSGGSDSNTEYWHPDTAASVIALGQGPISANNVAQQVASGSLYTAKSPSGATVVTKNPSAATISNFNAKQTPVKGGSSVHTSSSGAVHGGGGGKIPSSSSSSASKSSSSSSKSSSSSSSSKSSSSVGIISKVVNTVKSWFS